MRYYYAKKVASGVLVAVLAVTLCQPMIAGELDTEIPSAGAAVVIDNYIASKGSAVDLTEYLPTETVSLDKKEDTSSDKKTENTKKTDSNKYFEDIAIAKVSGGAEDYVNVRKKPSTDSKIVGKIYNNCGAVILEKTDNGWYKMKSGNCVGYIKAEFFATGDKAENEALDNGYVFANIKDTGVHVREKNTTESGIVTNVYHNENYTIKKFDKTGEWVKIKIGPGVSGWVSSQFVNVSIDMDTAITLKEEREMIRRQQEEAERIAREAAETAEAAQQQDDDYSQDSSDDEPSYTAPQQTYGDGGSSSSGVAVVAYAKQFLGNPYVYGGASLTNGTDCSGFTMSVYAHFGYSLNRTSYTQVNNGRSVSMSSLQAGDLLFYKYNSSTISHVAMYIGGGQIIHASTENTGIIISGMGSPCAARRIVN